jgi:hypothetical protein
MIHLKKGQTRKADRGFDPEIYDGLQIPKEATHSVKSKVKTLVVEPKMTNDEIKAREGTYFTEKDIDTLIK